MSQAAVTAARERLDAHVREIVRWHFSPETGCPFWLNWAKEAGWNPATEITVTAGETTATVEYPVILKPN